MDALGGLLDTMRAHGAFALRGVMRPPWSLRIETDSPLTLIAGVAGESWVVPDAGEPLPLGPGDVVVARAPERFTVADAPGTPPTVFVRPGRHCRDAAGNSLREAMTHGARTWGNDADGPTVFLVGAWEHPGDVGERLLEALPPMLSLSVTEWRSPLVPLLGEEVAKDEPGQAAVLDRLLDLLLTAVLRAWFARHDASRSERWRLRDDRVVARALRLLHEDPVRAWTIERLASESGASRASLARRFRALVGEPPMTYLKRWRMALAADLLCRPGETVATVAEKVGYANASAFGVAFERVRGQSPREFRERVRAGATSVA